MNINAKEILGIKPGDTSEIIVKKYNKKIKLANNDYEKNILYESYKECMKQIDPELSRAKKTLNNKNVNIKTTEEFSKLNNQINDNPQLRESLFYGAKPVKKEIFNGIKIDPENEMGFKKIGKNKSMNMDHFNQLFDEMKSKNQKVQGVDHYDDVSPFEFNSGVSNFQSVASYGGLMLHTGESETVDTDSDQQDYFNRTTTETGKDIKYFSKIDNKNDLFNHKKNKLIKEVEKNKKILLKNSHLFNKDPRQLEESFVNINYSERIDNIINPRFG